MEWGRARGRQREDILSTKVAGCQKAKTGIEKGDTCFSLFSNLKTDFSPVRGGFYPDLLPNHPVHESLRSLVSLDWFEHKSDSITTEGAQLENGEKALAVSRQSESMLPVLGQEITSLVIGIG